MQAIKATASSGLVFCSNINVIYIKFKLKFESRETMILLSKLDNLRRYLNSIT